jgi:hypothetical protein
MTITRRFDDYAQKKTIRFLGITRLPEDYFTTTLLRRQSHFHTGASAHAFIAISLAAISFC